MKTLSMRGRLPRHMLLKGMLMTLFVALSALMTPRAAAAEGTSQTPASSKTIVFVHGMFMTANCWDEWKGWFEQRGYTVLAPAWPHHDRPVEELRKAHPDAALGQLKLEQVVEHFAALLRPMEPKPILIGHSMGGLIVQLLLQQKLGSVGVAIDSAPPRGVNSLKWSFLKSNLPVVNPFADRDVPYLMDQEAFNYTFVHTLSPEAQRAAYERFVVPESRRVAVGPTTDAGRIDFAAPRPPLLLIAGAEDRITPASLNRTNARKYKPEAGITDFHEFSGRTHFIVGQEGWQEVTEYIVGWVNKTTQATPAN